VQDQERDDALDGSHSHTPTKSDVRNVYRIVARLTSKRAKGENRSPGGRSVSPETRVQAGLVG